jgi:hypothetical protein
MAAEWKSILTAHVQDAKKAAHLENVCFMRLKSLVGLALFISKAHFLTGGQQLK